MTTGKKMTDTYVAHPDESDRKEYPGALSYPIFNDLNTPIAACSAMFNVFFGEQYPEPGVHDDHEGFYVVSGHGKMKIDNVEYDLTPGCAMYAPAGVPHAIRKVGKDNLRVFIYHFPK